MKSAWRSWLRHVAVGLGVVGMVLAAGCSGHGGCSCEEEKPPVDIFGTVFPADENATTTTLHQSSGGTHPDDASSSDGSTVTQATLPPLPSVSDNPSMDMITNWTYFFSSYTPISTKMQLLENGDQHVGDLTDLAAQPWAQTLRADVTKSSWSSDKSTGTVVYSLYSDGKQLLADRPGVTTLQDGVWKVSEQSFAEFLNAAKGF
jgi:hypothetical protein